MAYLEQFVDISNWQGHIDWDRLNATEWIKWVYCNIGDGTIWERNVAGAPMSIKDAYLECAHYCQKPFGPYYYGRGYLGPTVSANMLLDRLTGKETLPPVLDLEDDAMNSREYAINWSKTFFNRLQYVQEHTPILYVGAFFKSTRQDTAIPNDPRLLQYPWWLAQYATEADCNGPRQWDMWQHTSSAYVPGIAEGVDLSRISDTYISNITTSFVDRYHMKQIAIPSSDAQWFLTIDGNGVVRRTPITSQTQVSVYAKAGLIDEGNNVITLTDPTEIHIFSSIPEANEQTNDGGALRLATNIITAVNDSHSPDVAVSPDALADAILRRLGIGKV